MIIGMLTLLILRWLHLRVRRPLQAQMQVYRQHVVQLSDDIDALCERHRMLPFTDKDYKEPMLGETLSMYDGILRATSSTFLRRIRPQTSVTVQRHPVHGRARRVRAVGSLLAGPGEAQFRQVSGNCRNGASRESGPPRNRVSTRHYCSVRSMNCGWDPSAGAVCFGKTGG